MSGQPSETRPRWMRLVGGAAIAAAVPSAVWRVVVGSGVPLGTPEAWRLAQELPGAGTVYVLTLSAVQLLAALLTLVLVVPGADRVPRWSPVLAGRRFPTSLVACASSAGAAALAILCLASALAWERVDPFAGAPASGWSLLCHACYVVTPAWPLLLAGSTVGYLAHRRRRHPRPGFPVVAARRPVASDDVAAAPDED